jgi:hypothetical protein
MDGQVDKEVGDEVDNEMGGDREMVGQVDRENNG